MIRSSLCFLLALQILSWVSATTRILAPNDACLPHQSELVQNSLQTAFKSKKDDDRRKEEGEVKQEEAYHYGRRGKIWSSRPSCEHKCYKCNPCEAIQMPTVAGESRHVSVQYTNEESATWKRGREKKKEMDIFGFLKNTCSARDVFNRILNGVV